MTTWNPDDLHQHARFLRALARGLGNDEATAEDLTQDTLVAALERPPADPSGLGAWLKAVLRNRALVGWRGQQRREWREAETARGEALPSSDEITERAELHHLLGEALSELPEQLRDVIHLRFYEGLSLDEIASRSGSPKETIRTRQRRGLELLRERLDRHCDGDRSSWLGALLVPVSIPATHGGTILPTWKALSMGLKAKTAATLTVVGLVALLAWKLVDPTPHAGPGSGQDEPAIAMTLPPDGLPVVTEADAGERVPVLALQEFGMDGPAAAAAFVLSGTVQLPEGELAPGVEVELMRSPGWDMLSLDAASEREHPVEATTTAGSDGAFRFEVQPGVSYCLRVPAGQLAGFAQRDLAGCFGGSDVTLVLGPAASLTGYVADAGARLPIEGGLVRLVSLTPVGRLRPEPPIETTTDAAGRFSIGDFSAGIWGVTISAPGHVSTPRVQLDFQPGQARQHSVELEAGFTLAGRVTDARTGEPIAGAEVAEGWVFRGSVRTNIEGEYTLAGAGNPGRVVVHVRADGYGRTEETRPAPTDGMARLDFTLETGRHAVGRVLGPGGKPIEGAYVAAVASFAWANDQKLDSQSALTKSDGSFELTGLRRDMSHSLLIRSASLGTRLFDFPDKEDELDAIDLGDLQLHAGGHLSGLVLDSQGEPVAGIVVHLRGANPEYLSLGHDKNWSLDNYVGLRRTTTDDDGRFHYGELPGGDFQLRTLKRDRAQRLHMSFRLGDGESRTGLVLALDGSETIAGQVLDRNAQPVPNSELSLMHDTPEGMTFDVRALSDATGNFRFEALEPGTYTLSYLGSRTEVPSPYLRSRMEAVHTGDLAVQLVIPRSDPVAGVVLDSQGNPVPDAFVAALGPGGEALDWARSGSDGSFTLGAAEATTLDVRANAPRTIQTVGSVDQLRRNLDVEALLEDVSAGTTDLIIRLP